MNYNLPQKSQSFEAYMTMTMPVFLLCFSPSVHGSTGWDRRANFHSCCSWYDRGCSSTLHPPAQCQLEFFQACNLCGEIFSPADDKPREEWALDSLEFPWNKVSSEFHNYCGKPSFRTSAGAADRGCAAYFIELYKLQQTQGTSATCVVKYFLLLLIWQITRRVSIKLI